MSDDRRATLEAIAYGDDPSTRPADRLKAIDQLEKMEPGHTDAIRLAREVIELPEDLLGEELDAGTAMRIGEVLRDEQAARR